MTGVRFDEMDLKILKLLVQDSRVSQRALARAVGMSAPSVAERLLRLERAGVIRGYGAQVDFAKLGRPMSVVVDITSARSAAELDLADELVALPEVERVDILTGTSDLQVHVRVADQEHLTRLLFETLIASTPDIAHTETHLAVVSKTPENFAERLIDELLAEDAADDA